MPAHLKTYDLNSDDQVFFLHIPKTAGTTFTTILQTEFAPERICPYSFIHNFISVTPETLSRYQLFTGHLYYSLHYLLPRTPLYLTFLRDPIARTISDYKQVIGAPEHPLYNKVRGQSLHDFVCDPSTHHMFQNLQTRYLALDIDPRPLAATLSQAELDNLELERAMDLLKDSNDWTDASLLVQAKKHLNEFAFVGLADRFQESLKLLAYTFGWHPITDYEVLNVSSYNLNTEAVSEETLNIIRVHNQLDVELYNYAQMKFDDYLAQMDHALLEENYKRRFAARARPQ